MPYIRPERRDDIDNWKGVEQVETVGELNYAITRLCHAFLDRSGSTPRYGDFNEVIGVLECAKQEFYRRLVAPYENECIDRNGDVLPRYRQP